MSWPLVDLCDVARVAGGFAFKSKEFITDGYPIVRISNITGSKVELESAATVPESSVQGKERFLIESGDILIAMSGATTGKLGIVPEGIDKVYLNQRVGRFINDKNKLDRNYLYYFLLSSECQTQINNLAAGAAQPNISGSQLESIKIPLPPLAVQKQIAAVLEKADTLRSQCQQMEQELNTLAQSVFLFKVGDNHIDHSKWPLYTIESLCQSEKGSMRTGPFGSDLKHSEFVESGYPVIGIDNAVDNEFKWKERRFITEEKYQKLKRYTVKPKDIIITIMGTVGRVAVIPKDIPTSISTKHLAVLTINKSVAVPDFVADAFKYSTLISRQIKKKNKGAIMDGLNLGLIKTLELRLPPLKQQEDYIRQKEQLLISLSNCRDRLDAINESFNSLMQRAFKGELQLKDVA